jgi:hypothetical protein
MTDINLKTLTPDPSLPTTGFLFGADSQATANPSVYSTQTVATTLLGSTSLTGDTLTASAPVLNLTQTWDSSGITFTGMKFNVASDTSAASSLLMDLQVAGTSLFSVRKDGSPIAPRFVGYRLSAFTGPVIAQVAGYTGINNISGGLLVLSDGNFASGAGQVLLGATGVTVQSTGAFSFNSTGAADPFSSSDLYLTRKAAANLRFGNFDAATALAQTLSVQSVVAGTSNTAGAAFTITGSQGTGTGAGGSIVFKVAPAGGSGTAQNALVDALTIAGTLAATFANQVTATGFVSSGDVYVSRQIGLGYTNAFLYAPTAGTLGIYNGSSGTGGFAFIQGKLKTDNAYTAGTVVPTGYITIYDSTGTAYRVPCLV